MKRIAQVLIAITLVGTVSAQTSFIQKIKDKFAPAPQQNAAKPNPPQSQPGKNTATSGTPAKAATGPVNTANKPAASKPVTGNGAAPSTQKVGTVTAAKPATASAPVKLNVNNATAKPAVANTGLKPVADVKSAKAPTKISVAPVAPQPKQGAQKSGPFARPGKMSVSKTPATGKKVAAKPAVPPAQAAAAPAEPKEKKMITAEGRRDPFLSPVVNSPTGPGCSTGKRCLAIDQIILRGVVKSETGMIAVVVNAMNKAYFLKENDPVFNGYVVKITGDSVVFKESYMDKLGKEFTREVVKKITTPAV
ncbi:MAG TPA: hypothetical protein VF011_11185 [Terriglobales bacterium]